PHHTLLPSLFAVAFFLRSTRPPTSTLFPYTTLFRSVHELRQLRGAEELLDRRRDRLGVDQVVRHQVLGLGLREPFLDRPLDSHQDRKSTRLNSSHVAISYAVFCLKKKNKQQYTTRAA